MSVSEAVVRHYIASVADTTLSSLCRQDSDQLPPFSRLLTNQTITKLLLIDCQ